MDLGLLSQADLASQLQVSIRTLNRWHALRKGPPRIKVGGFIGYRRDALQKWLQANELQPVGRTIAGEQAMHLGLEVVASRAGFR